MLLDGDDDRLAILRSQLDAATVVHRELSGAGFVTQLSVPASVPRLGLKRFVLGDVYGEVTSLQHPAGFLLFVTDGVVDVLECFIVDEKWPEKAALQRPYFVHPSRPGSTSLIETKERDLVWAMRDAV